ncbi:protein XA-1 isoform X2 [Xenopus tropicalis]|uniref:Protein XA-1 isoform X2 n=1 Tax=Xenopus tropicalis TaxID=8364 RepID=A0A8J0SAM0_XENTR|nr:protein XA-1 isoform X2 [Xenopus tropicalis]|eukprot:XP_012809988.1 PREDICTED: protein XA-1-like isoform X2 [Xenopus tropicalis]
MSAWTASSYKAKLLLLFEERQKGFPAMLCYVLLLALVAPGWSHPPGRPAFMPPPPPPSYDLIKPWGHPEEFRTGAPLPTKNLPNEPEHGIHKSDLHHGKAAPTGVPHHTGEAPHHTGEVPHHTGKVQHQTEKVPRHTLAHSSSSEISHPPRPDITHESYGEKKPERFRTGAPLPPKKPEHGRHRRDLHHGKAIPTAVPHHTGVHSGSGKISHPPRHDHSTFTHSGASSKGKGPGHGQEHGKKPKH